MTPPNGPPRGGDPLPASGQERPLTPLPRETEVLHVLVRGHTNKEIAAALGMSATTANFHVISLIRKFAAANRTN